MFSFLFGNSKQGELLRQKYATIIQRLSNEGQAVIFKETKSVVAWGVANMGGKTIFKIKDNGSSDIDVSYLSESPFFGKFEKRWSFPSGMEQNEIVDKMNIDIQKLFTNGR
ncbi:hypothetical protein [Alistipes sp.]|uniref:hypothetical protein n=1 Tax=Alistipes sp. TaxID=1872444 RepID=UPI0025BD2F67|nr:hypothetical protein [Alistipes sp.]